ncbi:MAG: cyclic nucleotide-binding domain-containing protein [Cyanobacteriota bacterium]
MTIQEDFIWLQERSELNRFPQEILEALVPRLQVLTFGAGETIIEAEQVPQGLYILKAGRLERGAEGLGLLPGAVLNLRTLILGKTVEALARAVEDCQVWFLPAADFRELCAQFPQILQIVSQVLAQEAEDLARQLSAEQERQDILRPYLVPRAKRNIMGKSRYAVKLREQIKASADSREPALIFGEPGLEKDNTCALIHFRSDTAAPMVKVNCASLNITGKELFGQAGGKPGLLAALGTGTLLLNNIQELPPQLFPAIAELITQGRYRPTSLPGEPLGEWQSHQARILAISETIIPALTPLFPITIKIPPLRVRKADIEDYAHYYIGLTCHAKGIHPAPIAPEALRRLQAYDFPNNLRELANLVERAVTQLEGAPQITEEIIWPSQSKKKQFRWNLLNPYPQLRRFLRSAWWPDRLNYGITVWLFPLIVGILWFGPQRRSENFALNLFWAWWWPLILIGFPFVGRLWCAVCPFMIYGEITQKLRLWLIPQPLQKWPRPQAEAYGGWFLFGLFALILLWEELWHLQDTAYLSACLLLLITAGAMVFSALFERRFWCRYLCPIGGMNGMFAKLAVTELRAQQGTCSAECNTYQCYKGGPQLGEGQETLGCPLYSHPAQLEDNRDCVLCMTCLKACPHRSVEFNLRPPAIELWTTHAPRPYEVALLFLLLDSVFLRRLAEINWEWGLGWDLIHFNSHALAALAGLSLPALAPFLTYRLISGPKLKFMTLAYGYLPLALAANLAHYLRLGLGEGGHILPLVPLTFGFGPQDWPAVAADPAVIAFLQGTVLILGVLWSLFVTQKIGKLPFRRLWPQHLTVIGLAVALAQIIVGY